MFGYIMKDIMEVAGYLPIGILCGILVGAVYVVCILWSERGNRRKGQMGTHIWNFIVWFLLGVYLAVMFVTVFLSREPGSRQGIDMTLFGTWGVTPQAHAFVIENVLLFVPLGILYPWAVTMAVSSRRVMASGWDDEKVGDENVDILWEDTVRRLCKLTVPLGFLISVGIETIQLVTERGYCQLDDVVMNTLGSLLGYFVFIVVRRVTKKKS